MEQHIKSVSSLNSLLLFQIRNQRLLHCFLTNGNLNCYKIEDLRHTSHPFKVPKLALFWYFSFIHEFSKYSLNDCVPGTVPYIGKNSGRKGKVGPSSGSLIQVGETQTVYKNIYVNFSQEEGCSEIKINCGIQKNQNY